MKRPKPTISPRFRIDRRGNAMLAGIPCDDMRSILTWASLYYYDFEKKDDRYKNEPETKAWADRLHGYLEGFQQSMYTAFREGRPEHPQPPLKQRLLSNDQTRRITRRIWESKIT